LTGRSTSPRNLIGIRVLEELGFERRAQIDAYGSSEMYLYSKQL
jgi:hypothetical protein